MNCLNELTIDSNFNAELYVRILQPATLTMRFVEIPQSQIDEAILFLLAHKKKVEELEKKE